MRLIAGPNATVNWTDRALWLTAPFDRPLGLRQAGDGVVVAGEALAGAISQRAAMEATGEAGPALAGAVAARRG